MNPIRERRRTRLVGVRIVEMIAVSSPFQNQQMMTIGAITSPIDLKTMEISTIFG